MSIAKTLPEPPVVILRITDVIHIRGRSRSSHYADIASGLFPRQVQIGPRAVGHPDNEVAAMNAARIAGKSDEEIRALVVQIEAARKAADVRGVK